MKKPARLLSFIVLGSVAALCLRPRRAATDPIGAQSFGINRAIDAASAKAKEKERVRQASIAAVKAAITKRMKTGLGPKSTPMAPSAPLFVFVHDAAMIPTAMRAVKRIEAATGIKITVNAGGTIKTAHPIFGSDWLCANGTDGRTYGWGIALARGCKANPEKVMVHELLHLLGAAHLKLPARGILNEATDAPLDGISVDDIALVCAARTDCTRVVPEV